MIKIKEIKMIRLLFWESKRCVKLLEKLISIESIKDLADELWNIVKQYPNIIIEKYEKINL